MSIRECTAHARHHVGTEALAACLHAGGCVRRALRPLLLSSCLTALLPAFLAARQVSHCADAAQFLEQDRRMAIVTEPDSMNDWRTGKRQPGCRVTAAGATEATIAEEAARFYERVRAVGWTRTPDPRDAPNEASLRFRKRESDCLFNVYQGLLLLTEAELKVSAIKVPRPGESRYGVFVFCMAALPAAPRR
jgi:hypothetical protein